MNEEDLSRFMDKVAPADVNGCWIWTAGKFARGYGAFKLDGRTQRAHRVSYLHFVGGPIPVGMHLDHVKARGCRSTSCVNPEHLEAVTPKVNTRRGRSRNREKRDCPKGHELIEGNLRPDQLRIGKRACLTCHNERLRSYRETHRGLLQRKESERRSRIRAEKVCAYHARAPMMPLAELLEDQ